MNTIIEVLNAHKKAGHTIRVRTVSGDEVGRVGHIGNEVVEIIDETIRHVSLSSIVSC